MTTFASRYAAIFALIAIAAAGLACSASAAHADVADLLRNAKAATDASPADVLSAISNPKPYRQGVVVTCNVNNTFLGPHACVMAFDQVPATHLLQIDNVNCIGLTGNGGGAFIFNTKVLLDAVHLLGFALTPGSTTGASTASGPYYFKAGETPRLAMTGTLSTAQAFCSMFGTLWEAN